MSALREMLAAQDDAALTAIASVGLLRRARAGLGQAVVCVEETPFAATVKVDDNTVELSQEGPAKARCDCPAIGMCRHVLTAVLHLREALPARIAGPGARTEVAALSLAEIEDFAGVDWPQVLRLAVMSRDAVVKDSERSCVVEFADAPGPVTFLAGAGLRNAAFKGPEGRRKRFVAAAALIVGDHALPDLADRPIDTVNAELLDHAQRVISDALRHGMIGDPHLAHDILFDVAVSARVVSAPRLAALLRGVSQQAHRIAVKNPDGDPVAFLTGLAECAALVRALTKNPSEPRLTGQLRRDYTSADARQIAILGVGKWRTPSGARGLTIHGYDGREFLSSGPARAAGSDPTFSSERAYRKPFWPGLTPAQMAGSRFFLPSPKISADNVLSEHTKVDKPQPMVLDQLPFHADWPSLQKDLAARRGLGLLETGRPLPALVRFAGVGKPWFDQIAQRDMIEVHDRSMRGLALVVPNAALGQTIYDQQAKITGVLIEAIAHDSAVTHRLVSVYFGDPVLVWNVTLDRPPKQLISDRIIDTLRRHVREFSAVSSMELPVNRVSTFALEGLLAVCDGLTFPLDEARRYRLMAQAEALGLTSIAQGFGDFRKDSNAAALDLAWRLVLIHRASQERS